MRVGSVFFLFSIGCCWQFLRKPKEKMEKFKKIMQTGEMKLPKLNRLPKLSPAKSLQVPQETPFNPCGTSHSVCLNGGTCESRAGSFVCHCPPTHNGKKCELIADMTKCVGHKCRNGAACVSVPQTVRIVDPDLADQYNSTKKESNPLTATAMRNMMIDVSYECICRPGFVGPLCEMTEEEMECQEDYCMGRGTGSYQNGTCSCDCHENFIGQRCETENPCACFECMNSGTCHPVVNTAGGTVEAVCNCPSVLILSVEVTGSQCENAKLQIDSDETKEQMPCRAGDTAEDWSSSMRSVLTRMQNVEGWEKANLYITDSVMKCVDEKGINCHDRLKNEICLNRGKCEPRVVTLPPPGKISLLMPFCKCEGADTGMFCEYKRTDECDPTKEEKLSGVTRENRCTDEDHGTCVVVLGEPKCDCRAGYVGEMCETYDPCADNPCWNAECIPVPSETVVERGGEQKQTYRCLCNMGDDMSGPNRCVFSGTGNCTSHSRCHEGQCLSCEHSEEEEMMQICDEQQREDGFRCICKPGFLPPYCEKMANVCNDHLCENGAICQPTSKFDYTCQCPPGTRGSLCEEVTDICLVSGNTRCQSGSCVPDGSVLRGFSCDCTYDAYGRDCQFQLSDFQAWWQLVMENYRVTFPCLAVTANLIVLVALYFICSKPKKMKPADVEQATTGKTSKSGKSDGKETKKSGKSEGLKTEGTSNVEGKETNVEVSQDPKASEAPKESGISSGDGKVAPPSS